VKSWRPLAALLRVELRQLRRHPGRSWLVLLLVAVPVAAMVGGGTLHHITRPTAEERRAEHLGAASLRVDAADAAAASRAQALLPPGARLAELTVRRAQASVPGRRLAARAMGLDPRALAPGGVAEGLLELVEGRAPDAPGEVALSPVLADGLRRTLEQSVQTSAGEARIVGLVVAPEDLSLPLVLSARPADDPHPRALLLGSVDPELAERLQADGHVVTARADIQGDDELEALAILVVGGFGFFEAALVVTAAFAVGLRRRQREIGLLGASGAPASALRTSLLLSAAVLAGAGCVLGMVVGLGAAAILHPFLDSWNGRLNGAFEVSLPFVAGAFALALLSALLAAALPSRAATRLPIRVALSGRRPVTSRSGRGLTLGLIMVAGGVVLMLAGVRSQSELSGVAILVGSVGALLGFGVCSPWLLGTLARVAAPLPLPWRLAVRDAGRFRARNGPVVTAVLAGMAISVLVAALLTSIEAIMGTGLPLMRADQLLVDGPGAEELSRTLADSFGAEALAPLAAAWSSGAPVLARPDGEGGDVTWIALVDRSADDDLAHALADETGAMDWIADLDAGRLVSLVPRPAGNATLPLEDRTGRWIAAPEFALHAADDPVQDPTLLLSAERARELGLRPGPPPGHALVPWMLRLPQAVTEEQLERARLLAAESVGTVVDAARLHQTPDRAFYRMVLAVCLATGLIIIAAATALTSVESASDGRVLHTVGAGPGLLRTHLAARAAWLAFLGCALAIPAGLVPAFGLLALANPGLELPFTVPWPEVLIAVLGLPALTWVGAWSCAWLHPTHAWRHAESA
jgi:putative ABC transport system permease protein